MLWLKHIYIRVVFFLTQTLIIVKSTSIFDSWIQSRRSHLFLVSLLSILYIIKGSSGTTVLLKLLEKDIISNLVKNCVLYFVWENEMVSNLSKKESELKFISVNNYSKNCITKKASENANEKHVHFRGDKE